MTLEDFVMQEWEDLYTYVYENDPHEAADYTEEDIVFWVMNDEHLYNWAKSDGVIDL